MSNSKKSETKPDKSLSAKSVRSHAGRVLAQSKRTLQKEVSYASRVVIERTSTTLRKALKRLADR